MSISQFVDSTSGIVTTIFTAIFYFYIRDYWQSNKIKADLLDKLDTALKNNRKHNVSELFYMIHKVRINYNEILKLIEDDNSSKIIYALKRTPGLVEYKDGKLSRRQFPRWITVVEKIFFKFMLVFCVVFLLALLILLPFAKGFVLLQLLIQLIGVTIIIISFLRFQRNEKIIDELIKNSE
jgi:hypothetical protein